MLLAVGGITFEILGETGPLPVELEPYLAKRAAPDVECRAKRAPINPVDPERLLFDSGEIWCLDQIDGGIRIVLRRGGPGGVPFQALELSGDLKHAVAVIDEGFEAGAGEPFALREPAFELWACFLLMRGRGLLVHACGLLGSDGVRVFAGQSGAGKSTLAGILTSAAAGTILSDDRLVLRRRDDTLRVYGTPWHGEARYASPRAGDLAALYFLEQAPDCELVCLARAEAAARLAAACFMAGWPRVDLQNILDQAAAVVERVPAYVLRFAPERSVVAAIGLGALA